jgi:hypothetical protein
MTFSSSRTLPGQSYAISTSSDPDQLETGLPILFAVLLDEVLREQGNIVLAIAQRRQLHVDDVQAVEQILAEASLVHQLRRSPLVAAMMRTSTLMTSMPPSRMNSRSCMTRSSLACVSSGMLPISSRKMLPLSAESNSPFFG